MRDIRASEAKVFGGLSVLAFVIFVVMVFFIESLSVGLKLAVFFAAFCSLLSAYYVFRAQSIFLDGDEIVFEKTGKNLKRFFLEDVRRARTVPFWDELDIIWITTTSGEKAMTIVRQHDLTYLMSRFPRCALTPYWVNRTS